MTREEIVKLDLDVLNEKGKEYGDSWKRRGGVGAFMMLARKWDRIENQAKDKNWDIFKAVFATAREEGILDDIGDLRRYLILVEEEMRTMKVKLTAGEMKGPGNVTIVGEAGAGYVNQDRELSDRSFEDTGK